MKVGNNDRFLVIWFKGNKIKLMSLIVDQQKASQEFEREFQSKEKLRSLQESVFRNYTIKKSVSVIHPKSQSPSLEVEKKRLELFIPSIKSARERQDFPAVTTINFGNYKEKSHSQSARTLSQFAPKVTAHVSSCRIQREEKLLQKMKKLELNDLKKTYEARCKYETRDSQTLLRKNTLFLVNCLKTRYKQRKNAHVGQRPEAANHMRLGNFSEKQPANHQYQQRFQYMEEAKQRLLQARSEKVVEPTKLSRLSPLFPEPWQTDRGFY